MEISIPDPILLIVMLISLALAPFVAMRVTSFVKIVVVLSLLRNALGIQQIPPNMVINGLALILTIYIMTPIAQETVEINAMMLVLWLSMPPINVASFTGILVSLIQALTQVQEQTLSFAVKLVAVTITMLITARWLGGEMYNFSITLFESFATIVR